MARVVHVTRADTYGRLGQQTVDSVLQAAIVKALIRECGVKHAWVQFVFRNHQSKFPSHCIIRMTNHPPMGDDANDYFTDFQITWPWAHNVEFQFVLSGIAARVRKAHG